MPLDVLADLIRGCQALGDRLLEVPAAERLHLFRHLVGEPAKRVELGAGGRGRDGLCLAVDWRGRPGQQCSGCSDAEGCEEDTGSVPPDWSDPQLYHGRLADYHESSIDLEGL